MKTPTIWRFACVSCGKVFLHLAEPGHMDRENILGFSKPPYGVYKVEFKLGPEDTSTKKCDECDKVIDAYVALQKKLFEDITNEIKNYEYSEKDSPKFSLPKPNAVRSPLDTEYERRVAQFREMNPITLETERHTVDGLEYAKTMRWGNLEVGKCVWCNGVVVQKSWTDGTKRHLHSDCTNCGTLNRLEWYER